MGDRCWWHVQVPKEYVLEFVKHFSHAVDSVDKLRDQWDDVDETKHWYSLTDEQANYGNVAELEAATEANIPFLGYHGPGGDYGACDFYSTGDGGFHFYETSHDGGGIVVYPDIDGCLKPHTFEDINHFVKHQEMAKLVREDKPWKS